MLTATPTPVIAIVWTLAVRGRKLGWTTLLGLYGSHPPRSCRLVCLQGAEAPRSLSSVAGALVELRARRRSRLTRTTAWILEPHALSAVHRLTWFNELRDCNE